MPNRNWLATSVAAAGALASLGCAALGPGESQTSTAPAAVPFREASLVYRPQALAFAAQPASHTASSVAFPGQPAGAPPAAASEPKLAIVYPHPKGIEGMALVEVIVPEPVESPAATDRSAWRRWMRGAGKSLRKVSPGVNWHDDVQEAWALDLPVAELDQAFRQLEREGCFDRHKETRSGASLAIRVDRLQLDKNWSRTAALDRLIERVRQEGRLISHGASFE